jgi:hypothetical protein
MKSLDSVLLAIGIPADSGPLRRAEFVPPLPTVSNYLSSLSPRPWGVEALYVTAPTEPPPVVDWRPERDYRDALTLHGGDFGKLHATCRAVSTYLGHPKEAPADQLAEMVCEVAVRQLAAQLDCYVPKSDRRKSEELLSEWRKGLSHFDTSGDMEKWVRGATKEIVEFILDAVNAGPLAAGCSKPRPCQPTTADGSQKPSPQCNLQTKTPPRVSRAAVKKLNNTRTPQV